MTQVHPTPASRLAIAQPVAVVSEIQPDNHAFRRAESTKWRVPDDS
jgi:hypothetical protein